MGVYCLDFKSGLRGLSPRRTLTEDMAPFAGGAAHGKPARHVKPKQLARPEETNE